MRKEGSVKEGTVADLRGLGYQIEQAGQGFLTLTTRMSEAAIDVHKVPRAVRLAAEGLDKIRQALQLAVVPVED